MSAAVLDVGGDVAISRHSSAAFWGIPGFDVEPVEVVRGRMVHVRPSGLAVVHTSRDLRDHHVALVDGIRVTTPLRTIFDLAGSLHPKRTERLLDNAAGRRLCTYRGLHQMLDSFAGRGRAGVELLRTLADERPPGARPPERDAERRAELIAAGWEVREARDHDIWHRPQVVVDTVREGRKVGRAKRWHAHLELVTV